MNAKERTLAAVDQWNSERDRYARHVETEETEGSVCMATVAAEQVRFLWEPYLPVGKLTILEGDPSAGKSFMTAGLATALSHGRGLPESGPFEPCLTLFFSAEDGLSDTLRPRLDRMGADVSRVFAYDGLVNLSTPEGLDLARREVERVAPALVIFDPVQCYLGGKVDMHRANETRSVLAPLAKMAEEYSCAVLIVRHLAKARAGRALHAGLGSIDFTAAARSVILAGVTAEEPRRRAIVHTKCNVAAQGPSLGYEIGEAGFYWTGRSEISAADLLAPEPARRRESSEEEAAGFLRSALASGPRPFAELATEAERAGIAERTLRRARAAAGVVVDRRGFGSGSSWSLPGDEHHSGHSGQAKSLAGMEGMTGMEEEIEL